MSKSKWIYQDIPLAKIIDHPVNASIYGDNFDDDLVESIKREDGVIEPIHVVKHEGGSYVCLSGHRRRQAAKIAGLTEIPAMVRRGEMSDAEQIVHVVTANKKREKTTYQKARETESLDAALKILAAERKKRGKKADSDLTKDLWEGRHDRESLSQAAAETGIGSAVTAAKAIEVVHKVEELKAEGKTEEAAELVETLNKPRGVSAAHAKAKGKGKASDKPGPFADLCGGVQWCLTHAVARPQEVAKQAVKLLGKRAGLFDADAVSNACKVLHTEFSRIERETKVRAEAEKRVASDA